MLQPLFHHLFYEVEVCVDEGGEGQNTLDENAVTINTIACIIRIISVSKKLENFHQWVR